MGNTRVHDPNDKPGKPVRRPRALTPARRERQLIAKAVDLAEKQIDEGTVSAQVLSHFLKLASSREQLEQEHLEQKVELLKIQRETIASQQRTEGLMQEALRAFKAYSGQPDDEEEFYDD